MNKRLVILRTALLVFLLGVQTPQFAQDTSTGPPKPDEERLRVALGLVRTINTAELKERYAYGSFASWQTIFAHQHEYLDQWLSQFYSRDTNVHFGSRAEILPGGISLTCGTGWPRLRCSGKRREGQEQICRAQ